VVHSRRLADEVTTLNGRLDALQRAITQQQRETVLALESEARARVAAEESARERLSSLQRQVGDAAAQASQAATAATVAGSMASSVQSALATSVRDEGGSNGGMGSVGRAMLENTLMDLERRVDEAVDSTKRQLARTEADLITKVGRVQVDADGIRHAVQTEVGRKVESLMGAATASISELAEKLHGQAVAVAALTVQVNDQNQMMANAVGQTRDALAGRVDALATDLSQLAAATARREQALGDAILKGLQQEASARDAALSAFTGQVQAAVAEARSVQASVADSIAAHRNAAEAVRQDAQKQIQGAFVDVEHRWKAVEQNAQAAVERLKIELDGRAEAAEKRWLQSEIKVLDQSAELRSMVEKMDVDVRRDHSTLSQTLERRCGVVEKNAKDLVDSCRNLLRDTSTSLRDDMFHLRSDLAQRMGDIEAPLARLRAANESAEKERNEYKAGLEGSLDAWKRGINSYLAEQLAGHVLEAKAEAHRLVTDELTKMHGDLANVVSDVMNDATVKAEQVLNTIRTRMSDMIERITDERMRLISDDLLHVLDTRLSEAKEEILAGVLVEKTARGDMAYAVERRVGAVETYCQDWAEKFEDQVRTWQDTVNKALEEHSRIQKISVAEMDALLQNADNPSSNDSAQGTIKLVETAVAALDQKFTGVTKNIEDQISDRLAEIVERIGSRIVSETAVREGDVSAIGEKLRSMEADMTDLVSRLVSGEIGGASQAKAANLDDVVRVKETVERLRKDLDDALLDVVRQKDSLTRAEDALRSEMSRMTVRVTEDVDIRLKSSMREVKEEIESVAKKLPANMAHVADDIAALSAKMRDSDASWRVTADLLMGQVKTVEEKLKALEGEAQKELRLKEMSASVEIMERQVAEMRVTYKQLSVLAERAEDSAARGEARLDDHDFKLSNASTRLDMLEKDINTQRAKLKNTTKQIEEDGGVSPDVDVRLMKMERQLDKHTELLADTMTQSEGESLEERLNALVIDTVRSSFGSSGGGGVSVPAAENLMRRMDTELAKRDSAISNLETRVMGAISEESKKRQAELQQESTSRNQDLDDLADELRELIASAQAK
jgi:hypothetical protein